MALNDYYPQDSQRPLDVESPIASGRYMGQTLQSSWQDMSFNAGRERAQRKDLNYDPAEDEAGRQWFTSRGLEYPAPEPAPAMVSVEDANKEGEQYGLRYSEPQPRAGLDMDIAHKTRELNADAILSRSPGPGTTAAAFATSLAAGFFDPINLPLMFAPGLGEERMAELTAQIGSKTAARAVSGALSGAGGMVTLQPYQYSQAQFWQDHYGPEEFLKSVGYGAALGGVGHAVFGKGSDWWEYHKTGLREADRNTLAAAQQDLADALNVSAPGEKVAAPAAGHPDMERYGAETAATEEGKRPSFEEWKAGQEPAADGAPDLRKTKVNPGETPYIVDALDPEVRESLMEAATRAVADDKFPLVDELLKLHPEADSRLMWSARYPAQVRLRNNFDTSDFYDLSSRPARMIENDLQRRVRPDVENGVHPAEALFNHLQGVHPELKNTKFDLFPPDEYERGVEHGNDTGAIDIDPRQRAYYDQERDEFVASSDTTLGQLHHQIQAFLDDRQGFYADPSERGGYRFGKDDFLAAQTIRKAAVMNDGAQPGAAIDPRAQLEKFKNSPSIGVTPADEAAAQRVSDLVNRDKDKDLDTLIEQEEEMARESIRNLAAASGRDSGFVEKMLTPEERDLLEPKGAVESAERELEAAIAEPKWAGAMTADIGSLWENIGNSALLDAVLEEHLSIEQAGRLGRLIDDEVEHPRILSRIEMEAKGDEARADVIIEEEAQAYAARQAAAIGDEGLAQDEAQPAQREPIEVYEPTEEQLNRMEETAVLAEQAELRHTKGLAKYASQAEENLFRENATWRTRIESLDAFRGGSEDTQELTRPRDPSEKGLAETSLSQARPTDGWLGRLAPEASDGGAASFGRKARSAELGIGAAHRIVTPDGSMEVNAAPIVVERADLKVARGLPGGRGKPGEMANNLDPAQLGRSAISDTGAPIVSRDGRVIVGKKRMGAIARAYEWAAEGNRLQSDPYRFSLGDAGQDMREPVLVHMLLDDLSKEDERDLAERSNRPRYEMTDAAQRAHDDARQVGADGMNRYMGGALTLKRNKAFADGFLGEVSADPEAEGLTKDGAVTKAGEARIHAALLHAAYGDPGTMAALLESGDRQVKRLVSAYRDVAADFIKLKNYISAGFTSHEMDIAPYMTEAARIVHRYREAGKSGADWLRDTDPLDRRDPLVEQIVRSLYDDDGKLRARDDMAAVLRAYVSEAIKERPALTFEGKANAASEEFTQGAERVRAGVEGGGSAEPGQSAAEPLEQNPASGGGAAGRPGPNGNLAGEGIAAGRGKPSRLRPEPEQGRTAAGLDLTRPVNKAVLGILDAGLDREAFLKAYNVLSETGKLGREDIKRAYYALTGDLPGKRRVETMFQDIEANFKRLEAEPDRLQDLRIDAERRLLEVQSGLPKKVAEGVSEFAAASADRLRGAKDLATWNAEVKSLQGNKKLSKAELQGLAHEMLGSPADAKLTKDKLWQAIQEKAPKAQEAAKPSQETYTWTDEEAPYGLVWGGEYGLAVHDLVKQLPKLDGLEEALRGEGKPAQQARARLDFIEQRARAVASAWKHGEEGGLAREMLAAASKLKADAGPGMADAVKAMTDVLGRVADITRRKADIAPPAPEAVAPAVRFTPEARDRFFDWIGDSKPVKGLLQIARELGVSHDEASALIDYMVDYGWLDYSEKGDLVRVRATERPVRPARGGAADMFSLRSTEEPFGFTSLPGAEFARRLREDPRGLSELSRNDPMVRHSYDPEVRDRLAAIDRALGVKYNLRDGGIDGRPEETGLSGEAAGEGIGTEPAQGRRNAGNGPARGAHRPSEVPFAFPGYDASFRELMPAAEDGIRYRRRVYSISKNGEPAGEMRVRQASNGRTYVGWSEAPRGQGTAFYDAVQAHMGAEIRPSGLLTEAGYRFWLKRDPEAVKWHQLVDEGGEAYHMSPRQVMLGLEGDPASAELRAAWNKLPPEAKAAAQDGRNMFSLAIPHADARREAGAVRVRRVVDKASGLLPEAVQWRIMDSLRDPRAQYAGGIWHPYERLIEIADNIRSPSRVVGDEIIHASRAMGLLTDAEWKILTKASREKGWIEGQNIRDWYTRAYEDTPSGPLHPAALEDMLHEEAIGHKFGEFLATGNKPANAIEMIFDRIRRFFESIRNWMDGNGFKSADDVFAAVRRGDLADRPVAGDVRGGGYSLDDQAKLARDIRAEPVEDPVAKAEAAASSAEGLANCMSR